MLIETSNEQFDDLGGERHPDLPPGDYVGLSVSDTGVGMAEDVRRRIFEPFYTTKPVGKGTGLGLAMVYGAVHAAGGHVYVYSELQLGTRFRIYLPVSEPAPGPRSDLAQIDDSQLQGDDTVLLVEDEPAVRSLTARILERAGYSVISFGGGKEAVRGWKERGGRIDLLLTDVIMPGMSGKELGDILRCERPDLSVLYMSGYTDAIVASRGMLHDGEALLQKPFGAATLLRKVREVIRESPSRLWAS